MNRFQVAMGAALIALAGTGIIVRSQNQSEPLMPEDGWLIDACRERGECVFIHGSFGMPGKNTASDECERVDPAAGRVVKRWPVGSKWVDFPEHPENSGRTITCDNEPS